MNSYAFGKNLHQPKPNEPQIKIYCNVAYCNKDDAKSKGAKWNNDLKKWFFTYSFKDFKENYAENFDEIGYRKIISKRIYKKY